MNIQSIKQHHKEYLKVAKTLMDIRPIAHVISASTTITFLLVIIVGWQYFETICEYIGVWAYIISGSMAILVSSFYERKLDNVIDSLGIVIAGGESKRLIAIMLLISFPLIFIAASSSFLGPSEFAAQKSDVFFDSEIAKIESSLVSNSNTKSDAQLLLVEDRANKRKNLELKYALKLKKVPIRNTKKYSNWKTNQWELNELNRHNRADSVYLEKKLLDKLEEFDKESHKILSKIASEKSKVDSVNASTTNLLTKKKTERLEDKSTRLDWFGDFIGWIAVFALLISVLSSITARMICRILDIDPTDLKKKNRLAPTLSKTAPTKTPKNPTNSTNSAVGEGVNIDQLKDAAIFANRQRFSSDSSIASRANKDLAKIMGELNQIGIDIMYRDGNEKDIFFEKR